MDQTAPGRLWVSLSQPCLLCSSLWGEEVQLTSGPEGKVGQKPNKETNESGLTQVWAAVWLLGPARSEGLGVAQYLSPDLSLNMGGLGFSSVAKFEKHHRSLQRLRAQKASKSEDGSCNGTAEAHLKKDHSFSYDAVATILTFSTPSPPLTVLSERNWNQKIKGTTTDSVGLWAFSQLSCSAMDISSY